MGSLPALFDMFGADTVSVTLPNASELMAKIARIEELAAVADDPRGNLLAADEERADLERELAQALMNVLPARRG